MAIFIQPLFRNLKAKFLFGFCVIGMAVAPYAAMAGTTTIIGLADASNKPLDGPGVIRVNLPLPVNFLSPTESTERLGIIDADGSNKPAQSTVVTRHPNGSVAIVELSAYVQGTSSLGEPYGLYKVVELPKEQQPTKKYELDINQLTLTPEVVKFLTKRVAWVQAVGPMGEKYACNLFDVPAANGKTYKTGHVEVTVSLTCDLKPINGFSLTQKKEIPQILSVMAFFTLTTNSPVIKLHMLYGSTRVGVGAYVGDTYFKELKLAIPAENILVNDVPVPSYNPTPSIVGPFAVYDIVKAQADGASYVAPKLSWRQRIFAITTAAHSAKATAFLNLQGQAFAKKQMVGSVENFNWENPLTANYALGEALPDMSWIGYTTIRNKWKSQWDKLKGNYKSGTLGFPYEYGVLGDAYPVDSQYGGVTGGGGIDMIPAGSGVVAGAADSIRWFQYRLGSYLDRQLNKFPIQADGTPWSVDNVLKSCTAGSNPTGLAQKAQFSMIDGVPINPTQDDPFGITAVAQYGYHKAAAITPSTVTTMLGFSPIDFQHHVRFNQNLFYLINIVNDPVSRYLLRATAENIRAAHTIYAKNNTSCKSLYNTLYETSEYVKGKPGKGAPVGRADADLTQAMAEAYASGDDQWRSKNLPWLNTMSDVMVNGQVQCSGLIMAKSLPKGKGLPGDYDFPEYHVEQELESSRLSQALEILYNKVYNGYDSAKATKVRNAQNLYITHMIDPEFFIDGKIRNKSLVYDAKLDKAICPADLKPGMIEKGNGYQIANDLLRGLDRTGNVAYSNVANNHLGSSSSLMQDLKNKFTTSSGQEYYWESWSPTALDLAQKHGVQ